jgi:hypothetical protein
MAIELTDEIRKAVWDEFCQENGHQLNFSYMVGRMNGQSVQIEQTDEGLLPHIFCERCGRVWIVIDESYPDYETAEDAMFTRMKVADAGRKRIQAIRDRRAARQAEEAAQQGEPTT